MHYVQKIIREIAPDLDGKQVDEVEEALYARFNALDSLTHEEFVEEIGKIREALRHV